MAGSGLHHERRISGPFLYTETPFCLQKLAALAGTLFGARACFSLLILFPDKFPVSREFVAGKFRRFVPC
jgi:hypothetical protein